tara:strand:- start:6850 stop:7830 length:981 start_codon:yes stop_codon:yes gene_type:complete
MYRPDQGILKHTLKQGKYVLNGSATDPKLINEALSFPLISLSIEEVDKLRTHTLGIPEEDAVIYEPVFDEAVMHFTHLAAFDGMALHNKEVVKSQTWAAFYNVDNPILSTLPSYPSREVLHKWFSANPNTGKSINPESVRFLFLIVKYDKEPPVYLWHGWCGLEMTGEEICLLATDGSEEYWVDSTGKTIDKGLKEHAAMATQLLLDVFLYSKYGERHAVEKTSAKPKTKVKTQLNSKRPWTTATGPHILFLDRLPTNKPNAETGTGTPKKPHRRRGHWRILQDPRYRHHPQYGKRIYVKPSFIGPEQTIYEGNIYKLIKPLDEIL